MKIAADSGPETCCSVNKYEAALSLEPVRKSNLLGIRRPAADTWLICLVSCLRFICVVKLCFLDKSSIPSLFSFGLIMFYSRLIPIYFLKHPVRRV